MASEAQISECFDGLNINLDIDVVKKGVDLCAKYQLEAEDFLDQWLAYSTSQLGGAPPTVDSLERMERRELQGKMKKVEVHSVIETETLPHITSSNMFYNSSNSTSTNTNIRCWFGNRNSNFESSQFDVLINVGEDLSEAKYMFCTMNRRRLSLYSVADWISNEMKKRKNILMQETNLELSQSDNNMVEQSIAKVTLIGRIYSRYPNKKLDIDSIILEPLDVVTTDGVDYLEVKINHLENFALFPGQVVIVEGYNIRRSIQVDTIHSLVPTLMKTMNTHESIEEPLEIIVAAGPFTSPTDLLYEPLNKLICYIKQSKPHVVMLLGPFMDKSHENLKKLMISYDNFFQDLVDSLMGQLQPLNIQVVLIPSPRDVHAHRVFPTMRYNLKRSHDNVKLSSNPCHIDINGFTVAASTVDILLHLSKYEIVKDEYNQNQIRRLLYYVLGQLNFYPLDPPEKDVNVDHVLLEKYGLFKDLDNLFILPSDLDVFINNVGGCIVINPGRLTNGNFARVELTPGDKPMCQRINVQVMET